MPLVERVQRVFPHPGRVRRALSDLHHVGVELDGGNVFDRETGKVVGGVDHNYACCRFTMSEPYILGANMDMIDLSAGSKLVSTGPAIDSRECLGAVVSNGRIFYTSQASGFIVSQTYGEDALNLPAVWNR